MPDVLTPLTLDEAVDLTRTGDLWLFRGRSLADRAIQTLTNAPVNHVGMAIVLEDLPPLMWHAELGRSLPDVWTGERQRGAQLHDLRDAVTTWAHRYGQRAWLRQLEAEITPAMEDAVLRTVARRDGTPFPSSAALAARWWRGQAAGGRWRPDADLETAYCAEIVAVTYQEMGLLPSDRTANWYDPGRFWSGDDLELLRDARLGAEIAVDVPAADPTDPAADPTGAGTGTFEATETPAAAEAAERAAAGPRGRRAWRPRRPAGVASLRTFRTGPGSRSSRR